MGLAYLDHAATSPVRPSVLSAVTASLQQIGNPSSVHRAGREARSLIEQARDLVGRSVGAPPERVVFTSGATEANNIALQSFAEGPLLASAVEHDSVLAVVATRGGSRLTVDQQGIVDLGVLRDRLAHSERPGLIAVMLVNNETGVIQPVAEIAHLARSFGWRVHCDAVQALGKMPVDMASLGVDTLTLSAHKVGGPPGVGALVLGEGVEPVPVTFGGGQERRRRPGTENMPGIVGMGVAVEEAVNTINDMKRLDILRIRLEDTVRSRAPSIILCGDGARRVATTSCLVAPGLAAETQLMVLDLEGVAVSSGSACSSGKVAPSHVLTAMGLDADKAACAIRVSLGWSTTVDDIDSFLRSWLRLLARRGLAKSVAA